MKKEIKYKTLKLKTDIDNSKTLRIDPRQLIDIPNDSRISLGPTALIEVRAGGTLENHALYLPSKFDWVLGKDTYDIFCLVPLQKEEDTEEKRSEQLEKIIFALAESNIDRDVCDDIIEKLEQHESTQLQEAAKHPWGHGR